MSTDTFKTWLTREAGGIEVSVPVVVTIDHSKGVPETSSSPAEPPVAICSAVEVEVTKEEEHMFEERWIEQQGRDDRRSL